jgi:Barrier to autointegration factor
VGFEPSFIFKSFNLPLHRTIKQSQFYSNPIGNQSVKAIPGIGAINRLRLKAAGYEDVS